ncbi:epoxide hydrolase 4-like [Watersipora subatra]|uniref:epoxide hydrolase 4-like n=1 Tax=Watersipora subatra TaxID=2589382 RepID=UPI00355BCAAB
MASAVQRILVKVIFYISIAIWGCRGILMMLSTIIKFSKVLFVKKNRSQLPSCATDPSLGTHDSLTLNFRGETSACSVRSLKIKYVANGKSGLPLMLCIHGFPECWYSWRHQLKEFSSKYRVVAIDLPGYGDSDKPADKDFYSVTSLVDTIAQIIIELGYESATIVSHDWGGALAWNFAVNHADKCEQVIVMNAPNAVGFQKGFTFKQYCMSWYMFFFQLPWLPEFMMSCCDFQFMNDCFRGAWGVTDKSRLTDEDVEVYKYSLSSWEARNSAINYYRRNNMLSRDHFRGKKFKLECPVLLIWGTEDQALSLELAAKSANASDLITLEYVEGASHWVQQDNPEEVNRLMWEFLNSSSSYGRLDVEPSFGALSPDYGLSPEGPEPDLSPEIEL